MNFNSYSEIWLDSVFDSDTFEEADKRIDAFIEIDNENAKEVIKEEIL